MKRNKPMRRQHPETENNYKAYQVFRPFFLREHPICEMKVECLKPSNEIHHMKGHGYRGRLLCSERWLKASCIECHAYTHSHMKKPEKKDWFCIHKQCISV